MQHSKCCVVSQPPWVQIPALPPLPPGPNGAGRFCYAWMVCGRVRVCACWGRAAWCARGRRATWLMVCPWAAARPRAVRAASFARRVVSKPSQALPPPTGTTTRPLRHRSQAPHDFWYCYVAPRVFQTPPTPSTPAALGMLTYGLAHHPEARVGTASTHRHGSRTPLPRCRLFLSGVTPFSWALHHFPGGVMLPNWCNAP